MTPSPTLPGTAPVGRPARRALLLVLAAYLVLALAYGAVVPVFEQPDEHTHFFMAQRLAETGRLPVQPADEKDRGPWEQQGSQPPLYYALAAPLLRLAGGHLDAAQLWYNDQNSMGIPTIAGNDNRFIHDPAVEGWPWHDHSLAVHLARLLSTLLGLVTVWLVWWIARRVFPDHELLAVGAAAVVALNPQFLAVHAALSNDPAVIVLATAALALMLRLAEGHDDWRTILALAAVAGLAPLAKLSGLAVVGFVGLTLVWLAWRRRDLRWLLRTAGPVVLATLLLSGWWYLRNLQLYGDVTGLNFMHPGGTRRHVSLGHWLEELPAELNGVWLSTWGLFGWFTILLPDWVYALATLFSLAALAGLFVAWHRRVDWLAWPVLGWLTLWGGVVFVSLLRWLAYTKGGQGRLLFPAVALLGPLLVAGWRALLPRRVSDRALATTAGVALAVLSLGALVLVVRPAYALAERIPLSAIPASATRVDDVVFDGKLKLVAIEHPDRVVEGEQLPVTLYWQALAPMTREGLVSLRADQTPVGRPRMPAPAQLAHPNHGTTPLRMISPGPWVIVDQRSIAVPASIANDEGSGLCCGGEPFALPSVARLGVGVYDPESALPWPRSDTEAGADWASAFTIVPRRDLPVAGSAPPLARFDNGIEVYQANVWDTGRGDGPTSLFALPDLNPEAWERVTRPQDMEFMPIIPTPILWRSTRSVAEDLSAFVHVVDETGRTAIQFDGPPATNSDYPTSRWQPNEWVPAWLKHDLPEDEAPGHRYRLEIGLYRPSDGSRIAAYRADGSRWPNDIVTVWNAKEVQ